MIKDRATISDTHLKRKKGRAGQRACPGDSVLLAPACASFDMYSGYQQRGEVFIAAVHKWVQ